MNDMTPMKAPTHVNGFDLAKIEALVAGIQRDPGQARIEFKVRSAWKGQTRSDGQVESYRLGGQEIRRDFHIAADEPLELDGSNIAPNPQELLMAALNACMIVGYAANAALRGVSLTVAPGEVHALKKYAEKPKKVKASARKTVPRKPTGKMAALEGEAAPKPAVKEKPRLDSASKNFVKPGAGAVKRNDPRAISARDPRRINPTAARVEKQWGQKTRKRPN